jgi:hypothetical protein
VASVTMASPLFGTVMYIGILTRPASRTGWTRTPSRLDRELFPATTAAAQADPTTLYRRDPFSAAAMRAGRAIRPECHCKLGVGCGFVMEVRGVQNRHGIFPGGAHRARIKT